MKQNQKKSLKIGLIEFIKSNIAGNALFVTTYITYFICESLLDLSTELSLLIAMIVGNTLGNLINFIAQKYWVFHRQNRAKMQASRYIIFIIVNAGINYAIILGLERYLQITPYIGQFIAGWFFWIWNFIWYKYWVFERTSKDEPRKTKQKTA